jgi:hypothetical protein
MVEIVVLHRPNVEYSSVPPKKSSHPRSVGGETAKSALETNCYAKARNTHPPCLLKDHRDTVGGHLYKNGSHSFQCHNDAFHLRGLGALRVYLH